MNVAVDLRRRAINFNAIAGGEQYDFVEPGAEFDAAAVAGKQRGMHGQFLANFHRRGPVAYACDEQFHALAFPFCQSVNHSLSDSASTRFWRSIHQPPAGLLVSWPHSSLPSKTGFSSVAKHFPFFVSVHAGKS